MGVSQMYWLELVLQAEAGLHSSEHRVAISIQIRDSVTAAPSAVLQGFVVSPSTLLLLLVSHAHGYTKHILPSLIERHKEAFQQAALSETV